MAKDPLKELGSLIQAERERQGISIDQLALESRVSSKHIQNIENANRANLPEDTFLISFLTKIMKALKIPNTEQLLSHYRVTEGDYVLQSIIDIQEINSGAGFTESKYFKIYHLYIVFALFLLICLWVIFNKANEDFEYNPIESSESVEVKKANDLFSIFTAANKKVEESKKEEKKPEETKNGTALAEEDLSKNGQMLTSNGSATTEAIEATDSQLTKPTEDLPKRVINRGSGGHNVRLYVKDDAWVQVIGVGSKKILFEGDVSALNNSMLDLKDDVGFVLATGNAGAFDVDVGSGSFKLGQSGQLIKWFYPEAAKTVYKTWSQPQEEE